MLRIDNKIRYDKNAVHKKNRPKELTQIIFIVNDFNQGLAINRSLQNRGMHWPLKKKQLAGHSFSYTSAWWLTVTTTGVADSFERLDSLASWL